MIYQFHPEAEAEHLETVAYYETQRAGLGASYLTEFESILDLVCESPTRYPIQLDPDIRRVILRRFPFTVLFRESGDTIQVLAVAHHRRRPSYWLGRS
ncbi:MAG: type II toxin-antitoxin system RelE/ParE family toxin [Chloroflexi bacterium]|nr:type II toxin-antitoxin system RelE/ParE family toxin [Chloroflexota bacterium]